MSSTNRSNARQEHVSDYYVTPIHKIVEFLDEFKKVEPELFNPDNEFSILDPCAGGDEFHPMSYPSALIQMGINERQIFTMDIREDSLAEIKHNYLSDFDVYGDEYRNELDGNGFKLVITNPPFLHAKEIIEKAIDDVSEGGFVVMLLRLNFFGGKLRRDLWEKHMPKYCFVHHRRMSFTDDGKTDSIEYAHFVWQKGFKPEFTQIKVI